MTAASENKWGASREDYFEAGGHSLRGVVFSTFDTTVWWPSGHASVRRVSYTSVDDRRREAVTIMNLLSS